MEGLQFIELIVEVLILINLIKLRKNGSPKKPKTKYVKVPVSEQVFETHQYDEVEE